MQFIHFAIATETIIAKDIFSKRTSFSKGIVKSSSPSNSDLVNNFISKTKDRRFVLINKTSVHLTSESLLVS